MKRNDFLKNVTITLPIPPPAINQPQLNDDTGKLLLLFVEEVEG